MKRMWQASGLAIAAGLLVAQAPAPAAPAAPQAATPPAATPPAAIPAAATGDVVARAGDVVVTMADVKDMISHADPQAKDRILHDPNTLGELVRSRLVQLVILKQAATHKWADQPDIAFRVAQARDQVVSETYVNSVTAPPANYPSAAELQQAYEANKERFQVPRAYHLAQVFLPVAQGAPAKDDQAAKKALEELRAKLTKAPNNTADAFASAARTTSQDAASAGKGGDLGWLREDQLLPDIRNAITSLSDGGVSAVLHLPDGWHLVKRLGSRPPGVASLDEVKPQLVAAMRQQRQQQNGQAWLQQLQKTDPGTLDQAKLATLLQK